MPFKTYAVTGTHFHELFRVYNSLNCIWEIAFICYGAGQVSRGSEPALSTLTCIMRVEHIFKTAILIGYEGKQRQNCELPLSLEIADFNTDTILRVIYCLCKDGGRERKRPRDYTL